MDGTDQLKIQYHDIEFDTFYEMQFYESLEEYFGNIPGDEQYHNCWQKDFGILLKSLHHIARINKLRKVTIISFLSDLDVQEYRNYVYNELDSKYRSFLSFYWFWPSDLDVLDVFKAPKHGVVPDIITVVLFKDPIITNHYAIKLA